ncbi:LacI family DNA-binding transcriptional regulator [uncultured Pseudokineococcus sp.]|uniref:LacI family DNA-binding transcriptional regulator n=1 Tax=uncultured Pseudokineococcus sp. TaxID=1642928 RepID=UPI00261842CD|nr:LacI family DNA-binding transcriptional regulator [uncultured Pseudokineococcus sp.]
MHTADGERPPTTLQHVAALARVSPKTASRALNGERYVAPETAARVLEAARSVGYRVNAVARDLRLGAAPPLVGFVSADLANPFYSRLAAGVERELRPAGLLLVTVSSDEDPDAERTAVASLLDRGVRALVVASTSADQEHLEAARRPGTPLVMVDRAGAVPGADTVVLDNAAGAREVTAHLLARGAGRRAGGDGRRPHLAVVSDLRRLETGRARMEGVARALEDAGLPPLTAAQVREAHDAASAERAVAELLAADPHPTGVLAMNNLLATGAVRALARAGALGACAVAGFDDVDLAGLVGLATVSYDAEEMGREVGRLVLARVRGDEGPARHVVVPTRLVVPPEEDGADGGADDRTDRGADDRAPGHDRVTSLTSPTPRA